MTFFAAVDAPPSPDSMKFPDLCSILRLAWMLAVATPQATRSQFAPDRPDARQAIVPLTYTPPQSLDQLPYGLDAATIDFETGERKLDVDKIKIVAVEGGIVRQVGNGKIE